MVIKSHEQQESLLRDRKMRTARAVYHMGGVAPVLSGGDPLGHVHGYLLPSWTDKQTENITFPRTSYAGGKKIEIYKIIAS